MKFLSDKIGYYDSQIRKYQKLKNQKYIASLENEYVNLQKEEKKLINIKFQKEEELKRINTLINTSPILYINDNEFAKILKSILYNSSKYNVKISLNIQSDDKDFKTYKIFVTGESASVYNLYQFIKSIEAIRKIKEITTLKATKIKDGVSFDFILEFWSYR
jgi:ubiquitin-protein ligase